MSDAWEEDLSPIGTSHGVPERACNFRIWAGFGGRGLGCATGRNAAGAGGRMVIDFKAIDDGHLPPFEHSGIYDPSLTPFPPPDAPRRHAPCRRDGLVHGCRAKPAGPRRLQPVADRFFFWLRASMLETRRVANWWADRMVATNDGALQEKLALFWHGHFASSEEKVRD